LQKVGSPRFKLLYDIYHMQIMEGDVIATVKKHKDYIAHYHTGGVPGRNEIDETQELTTQHRQGNPGDGVYRLPGAGVHSEAGAGCIAGAGVQDL